MKAGAHELSPRAERWLLALGADPYAFAAFYRVQLILLSRNPRLPGWQGRRTGSQLLLYLLAAVFGLATRAFAAAAAGSPGLYAGLTLVCPLDRARFSMATLTLQRLLVLLPLTAAMACLVVWRAAPAADPLPAAALWQLAALLAFADLLLVLGKSAHPEFPFSVGRSPDPSGDRFVVALTGLLPAAAAVGLVAFAGRFGGRGLAAAALSAVLLHVPATLWARRRAASAAARLDLAVLGG